MPNESSEETTLSLYGFLVFSSYVRQLRKWFLVSGSGSTKSLGRMGTSLSRAAKTDIRNFAEFPLQICSFFCARFDNISVTQSNLEFYQIFLGGHKF